MYDPVLEFYKTCNLQDYEEGLRTLSSKHLIVEEFESVYNLFESGVIDQERVNKLYMIVKEVLLSKMS